MQGTTDEYANLRQPGWAPPSWLFGPVWTLLYALIAVAGWLVWRRVGFGPALWAWTAQLVLNAIWTPLFFGAGAYGLAFAEIVLMWLAIGADGGAVRPGVPGGGGAAAAVLGLGHLRRRAEPVDLAAEQLTDRSPAAAAAGDRWPGQQRGTPGM